MLNDPRTAITALRFAQSLVGDLAQVAQAATQAAKSGTEHAQSALGETFADVLSGTEETAETQVEIDVEELANRLRSFLQSVGVPLNAGALNVTLGHGDRFRVDTQGPATSGVEASVEQWINNDQLGDLGRELRSWLQANPGQPFVLRTDGGSGQS